MRSQSKTDTASISLRDGSKLSVRPVEPGDKALLQNEFAEMSDEARYRRFMTFKERLTSADLRRMTEVDHLDNECILAFDGPELVGSASYVRDPSRPRVAEVGLLVATPWRRRGVGTLLGQELACRARRQGIREFEASLLASNHPVLNLVRSVQGTHASGHEAGTVQIEVSLSKRRRLVRAAGAIAAGAHHGWQAAQRAAHTRRGAPTL